MRPVFAELPPVRPGDRVAVVSPAYAAPADFPAVHERGLAVLRGLQLVPVEYPTTRRHSGPAERAAYRADQRAAVLRAFGEYAPDAMIVFDVDLGHTDPQWVLPYGGPITVDGPARRITAHR